MTVAVCLQCGEFKHGAFTPCLKCGYTPDDDESLTRHLLASDHYRSRAELEAIARRVKAGQPVKFDPEAMKAAWVNKAALDAQLKRFGRGCAIGCLVVFVLSTAIAGYLWWATP